MLQMGGREVLVLSRDRFVEFDALTKAAEWVADYIVSPESLFTLRAGLAADPQFLDLLRLDLADLVLELARMTTEGRLRWLYNPRSQLPWRWRLPETPSFEAETVANAAEPTSLTSEAEKAEEDEDEYEEVKPEPVIPPEFPRLAKREADAVEYAAKKMGGQLDLMRFVGEKAVPESLVARAYPNLATQQAGALDDAVADAAGTLQGLVGGGGSAPKSAVANALPDMAKSAGRTIGAAADTLQKHTGSLLSGTPFEATGSDVAPAMNQLAERQGGQVIEQAALAGQSLDTLQGPGAPAPNPGTIGPALGSEAERQGTSIGNTAATLGEGLGKLNAGEVDPPPASETKTVLQQAADGQIIVIEQARRKANEVLDGIASGLDERAETPVPSNNASIFQKDGQRAGEAIGETAAATAATLDGLRPDDPKAAAANVAAIGGPIVQLEGAPGISLAGLLVKVRFGDEEKVFVTDASGRVEIYGAPKEGYDILGIEDQSGFEVAGVTSSALPPPAPPESDAPEPDDDS